MDALIKKLNQLTNQRFYVKTLSNGGRQLVNDKHIVTLGGPWGMTDRELTKLIKAFIKGAQA